ncbi:hypothetical protein LINPERHAP1_LOCUS38806 [Linum perenne]
MELDETELEVAYYIFVDGLLSNEVLVQNAHCFCDRGSMWSLLPGKWVDNFVITSLAYQLNLEQLYSSNKYLTRPVCFLPATLQVINNMKITR